MMGFVIFRHMGMTKSKVRTLDFRRTNFQFFEELLGFSRKPSLEVKELIRAGSSLRTLFLEHKSS